MEPSISRVLAFVVLVSLSLPAGRAAGDTPPQDATFSPQLFHPAVGPDEFFTVEPAAVPAHLNFTGGLWLNYTHGSFSLLNVDKNGVAGNRANVIGDQLGLDLVFAIGLFERLQLGIGIPMTLFQRGDDPASINPPLTYNGDAFLLKTPGAFALGDPWLDVKVRLYGKERGVNVSIAGNVSAPLSAVISRNSIDDTGNFGGESGAAVRVGADGAPIVNPVTRQFETESVAGVTAGGRLLAGWESERWRAGISVGYLYRQHKSHYLSSIIGDQLTYGAALAFDVVAQRKVTLVAEAFGRVDLSNKKAAGVDGCTDPSGCFTINNINGVPLEVDVGAKLRVARGVFANVGVGTGVIKGIGSPLVRAFLGLTWAPDRRDRDKDGVADSEDRCPDVPEDRDGFKDDDGCPDPDNDGDGVADTQDKCPNEAEDFDAFEDDDGCPDVDNDKDGIPDIRDSCPLDPEDHKAPAPNDGCPMDKIDTDNDGVPDSRDKCPLDVEDMDGFQDDDGCPDPDNDNDGLPDNFDKCPNEAEDADNFQDDDGCPDPDNDNDGVPDTMDKCQGEQETLNGVQDEDGCPDKGPPLKVQIVGDELVIFEKVLFKAKKAKIEAKSFNLLDQVTSVMKMHPEIKKLLIEGHTDPGSSRAESVKLSQDRADAVRAYMVAKGVEAARLEAKGFGPDRPVADNTTERGREANRRVQFKIVESAKKAEPAGAPAGDSGPGEPEGDSTSAPSP